MKSVHFSVDLAFEITLKQHTNFCNQSQTDTCRNNQWLSLDFDCRQTSAISTDKTFAVYCSIYSAIIFYCKQTRPNQEFTSSVLESPPPPELVFPLCN